MPNLNRPGYGKEAASIAPLGIFEAEITGVDDWNEPGRQAWVKVFTGPESWYPFAIHLEDLVASRPAKR